MLFSELYSAYYNTVAAIISAAFSPDVSEKELMGYIREEAFSESVLTILPSLKSGKWPLLNDDLTPKLNNAPSMPLTILQKRWLKAISLDPRVKLFGVDFPELSDTEPLFTSEDYRIYDRYADGDPFEDEGYIKHFRMMLYAIKNKRAVKVSMLNKRGKRVCVKFIPTGFEYSEKDDKIRIVATGCKYRHFNLARIKSCSYLGEDYHLEVVPKEDIKKEVTLIITDERNALERVMLHFAHLEKQAEKIDENRYLLRMKYYEGDETEMVIRVLSFGPNVQVTAPEDFKALIKQRLTMQKSCGLR